MSIIYKFPEEIEFAKHYAEKLNDELTLSILNASEVKNSAEARHLSIFFGIWWIGLLRIGITKCFCLGRREANFGARS